MTQKDPHESLQKDFSLLDLAQKLVGILVALGTLAYFIGWRYSQTYWQKFHAAWVVDLLSSSQMLSDASSLILPMVFAALVSFGGVLWDVRNDTLERCFRVLLLCGVVADLVPVLPDSIAGLTAARFVYSLGPFFIMSSAGVGIALFVRWLNASGMKWNDMIGNHTVWLFTAVLTFGPTLEADTHASEDTRKMVSRLDVITWTNRPEGDWRLGRVVDKGFVVIKLTEDPKVTEVRLIPFAADVLIRPVNERIM